MVLADLNAVVVRVREHSATVLRLGVVHVGDRSLLWHGVHMDRKNLDGYMLKRTVSMTLHDSEEEWIMWTQKWDYHREYLSICMSDVTFPPFQKSARLDFIKRETKRWLMRGVCHEFGLVLVPNAVPCPRQYVNASLSPSSISD